MVLQLSAGHIYTGLPVPLQPFGGLLAQAFSSPPSFGSLSQGKRSSGNHWKQPALNLHTCEGWSKLQIGKQLIAVIIIQQSS